MQHRVDQLAMFVDGEVVGDGSSEVSGVAPIELAGPGLLTFFGNEKYRAAFEASAAGCTLVGRDTHVPDGRVAIRVDSPYFAFAILAAVFHPRQREAVGVSERAFVADSAVLGVDVNVYPGACIGADCRIGDRVDIFPNTSLGSGCVVGDDSVLYANVSVYAGCSLGARVIVHSGAVIGADGFGYATGPNGRHAKIPHVGSVVVEDDVEIGANSTVDRAVMGITRVGSGTKIDNHVMVAHNVTIGRDCFLVSQCGVSGSTRLGDRVILAGQVGVVGHAELGDGVQVGAQAGVTGSLPAGGKYLGSPAWPARESLRLFALWKRLPAWKTQLKDLQKRMQQLERGLPSCPPDAASSG